MASPVINDQFWFDQSKLFVEQSRESRDAAAIRIQSFAGWAWTTFSTVTSFGLAYAGKPVTIAEVIVLGATSFSLMIVYWLATRATIPDTLVFDPRSPTGIREQYSNDILNRQRRIDRALFAGMVSAILVGFSLLIVSFGMHNISQNVATELTLSANLKVVKEKTFLTVSGSAVASSVTISIKVSDEKAKPLDLGYVVSPVKGVIQIAVPISDKVKSLDQVHVEMSWTQPDGAKIVYFPKVQLE